MTSSSSKSVSLAFEKFGESQICFLFCPLLCYRQTRPLRLQSQRRHLRDLSCRKPYSRFSWIRGAVEHRRPSTFPLRPLILTTRIFPGFRSGSTMTAPPCRLHAISEILINLTLLLRQRLCPYGRPIKCTYLCIFSDPGLAASCTRNPSCLPVLVYVEQTARTWYNFYQFHSSVLIELEHDLTGIFQK